MQWPTELTALILDNIRDGVCVIDETDAIRYWNRAAMEIAGYDGEEAIEPKDWKEIFSASDSSDYGADGDYSLRRKDGAITPISIRIIKGLGGDAGPGKRALIFRPRPTRSDANLEKVLILCDRREGESLLYAKLDEMRRYGAGFGFMIVRAGLSNSDSDNEEGRISDEILRNIGQKISNIIRVSDRVCRWDSDKLAVVMLHVTKSELGIVADRIRSGIERSRSLPKVISGRLQVSIGATLCRQDDNLQSLIARAEEPAQDAPETGDDVINTDGTEP